MSRLMHGNVKRFAAHHWSSIFRYVITGLACAASIFAGGYILLFVGKLDLGQAVGLMVATFVALLGLCVTAYVFVRTSSDTYGLSGIESADASENAFRSSVLLSFQRKLGIIIGFGLAFMVLSLVASGMSYSGYSAYDYPVQGRMGAIANEFMSFIRLDAYKCAGILSEIAVMGVGVMIVFSTSYIWSVIAYRRKMVDEARWQRMVIENILEQVEALWKSPDLHSASKESFEKALGNILSIYSFRLNAPLQSLDIKAVEKTLCKKCGSMKDDIVEDGRLVLLLKRYSDARKELAGDCWFYKKTPESESWLPAQSVAEDLWRRLIRAGGRNEDGCGILAGFGKRNHASVNVARHDYSGSSFIGAWMPRSEFLECEFDGVSFDGANLSQSNFRGSSLTHIEIVQSKWGQSSQLSKDHKEMVGFMGARFDHSLMTSVAILGIDKEDICLFSQSVFTDANLNDLTMQKVLLDSCSFLNVSMHGANFREVHFTNTEFVEARMTDADFLNVDLSSCSMRHALLISSKWDKACICDTSLEAASFIGATLSDMTLSSAYCAHAIFQGATIEGSWFKKAVLWNADFTSAHLSNVNFIGSQLDGSLFRYCQGEVIKCEITDSSAVNVSFMGTTFSNCRFRRTTFVSSSFQSCTFKNCKFIECDLRDARFNGSSVEERCDFINCFGMNYATYGGADLDGAVVHVQPDMLEGMSDAFLEAKRQPVIQYLERGEWFD